MTKYAKTRGGRSAIQKPLNGNRLSARHLTSMGKIQGTRCISQSGRDANYSQFCGRCCRLLGSPMFLGTGL